MKEEKSEPEAVQTQYESVRFTAKELEWIFLYFNKSLGLAYRGDQDRDGLKLEELQCDQFSPRLLMEDVKITQRIIAKTRPYGSHGG